VTTPASRDLRSPASLLLLGHAALAIAIFATDGHESVLGLLFVLAAIVAWVRALAEGAKGVRAGVDRAVRTLWFVALGSIVIQLCGLCPNFFQPGQRIKPPGIYLESGVAPFVVLEVLAAAVVATYWLDVQRARAIGPGLAIARRAVLFVLALAVGAWMLKASPNPKIDLFPVHTQAAEAMLSGRSIYEPGAIHTIETFRNKDTLDAYTYLPFGACFTTIAYALTHEIRWADLVAQLVGGLLLWMAARRCTPPTATPSRRAWSDLLVATFLFHPRAAFVLEQAWTEPVAIPFLGGFVVLALAGRPKLACVSLGGFFAMKQHLFLYAPFALLVPGVGISGLVVAGLVAMATIIPFAIPSPYNLYRGAILTLVGNPFRPDALNLPAELWRLGFKMPTWVGFVAALAPMAWLPRIPRQLPWLLLAVSITFGLFYVLGRQAFCNYYYLLDATVLFAAATMKDEGAGHAA
jgi:hypothetical protein